MFALHETTQRHVCRTAFVALCLAPTLATAAWTASHYWPGHKGRMADALAERLGVHVKLADWRYPRPGAVRSSGFSLSDPDSAELLCEASNFDERRVNGRSRISASQVIIDAGHWELIAEKADRWLAKQTPEPRDIRIGRLIIRKAGREVFCILKVEGRVDRDPHGRPRLKLTTSTGQQSPDAPVIELALAPSAKAGNASPLLSLEAKGPGVPAELLEEVTPFVGRLGSAARFTGSVQWVSVAGTPQGSLKGQVQNVDLAATLAKDSPHTLRGIARVEFSDITWRGTRIERLVGSIRAENALVSPSMVEAIVERFACVRAGDGAMNSQDANLLAIDQLAIGFQLTSDGLSFWGDCPAPATATQRCLATSGLQPLLLDPPYYNYHPAVLLQAFAAPGATWIPASREAIAMAERLPLPGSASEKEAAK